MNLLKSSRYSFLVVTIVVILIAFFRFQDIPRNELSWDTFGYYLYLPAKFIYNDPALLNQEWLNSIIDKYQTTATFYQGYKMETGNWIIKYTMGLSILWAPFFFLADFIAEPLGYEADGFSLPYQITLILGTLLYLYIGLIYMVKVLRHFFSDIIVALAILLITMGTNYFQLSFLNTLLTHSILFGGYAALIWYTIRWHESPQRKYAILIGILCGFITLVRPSEMTSIFIPLLWGIHNKASFQIKWEKIKKNWSHLVWLVVACLIAGSPQLLYWKSMTGSWVFYSYDNPGEGFEFFSPYTLQYLFSFRKGWLIYTPIISFCLVGYYYIFQHKRSIFWSLTVFLLAELWICSSWSTWWYAGGSYSARAMVSAYAILTIGLGYFLKSIVEQSNKIKFGILGLLFGLTVLNLFQTWQYKVGIIDAQRMTMAYYFKIFGKTQVKEEHKKLLLVERAVETYEHLKNPEDYTHRKLQHFNFDEENNDSIQWNQTLHLHEKMQFSPGIDIKFEDLTESYYAWIKAEAEVFIPEDYHGQLPMLTLHFTHEGKPYKYRTIAHTEDQVKKGQWQKISMDYMTPEVRNSQDNLKVYVWHRGTESIYIDNLKIDIYEPKN